MEYTEIISKYYDSVYDEMRSKIDLKFYLDEIKKSNGPVLEIGVGTGRIFTEALGYGADVYGIDSSENMLNVLKSKLSGEDLNRVSFADAREFKLGMKFDLIVIPFRVLSHIIMIEDQLKVFKNVYEHLNESGRLIFDVFLPMPEYLINGRNPVLDFEKEIPEGKLSRETIIEPDYVNQINTIIFNYILENSNGRIVDSNVFPMRYFFRYELEHLLQRSGFDVYNFFGDFERNPLENGKWEMVVEAYRNS
jgi:SAM-dependent methyltransferase